MNNILDLPRLVDGLNFETSREVHWNIPSGESRTEWRVPAGTRGVVRVNPKSYEVGFVFEGMTHPLYGRAPTIAKAGSPIKSWMNPIEKEIA